MSEKKSNLNNIKGSRFARSSFCHKLQNGNPTEGWDPEHPLSHLGTRKTGPNILLGVTGGIAAYKAVDLAGKLTAAGAKINTVMTRNACQLVGPKSFEAVTRSAVFTSLWGNDETPHQTIQPSNRSTVHIALVDWADIVVVAPATANIIGKIANGICDDLLSTTLCVCWQKPSLLAPAMNSNMWTNPAVQQNVETVRNMGFQLIGPEKGRLACGTEGIGRMAEPQDILKAIEKIAAKIKAKKRK